MQFPQPDKTDLNHPAIATLEKFFQSWMQKDWQQLQQHCQRTWLARLKCAPVTGLQLLLGPRVVLQTWAISKVDHISDAGVAVTVGYTYIPQFIGKDFASLKPRNQTARVMVVCETAPRTPDPKGTWGVNPISALGQGQRAPAAKVKGFG